LAFCISGYALAFGEGSPFIGLNNFLAIDLSFRHYGMLFFQASDIFIKLQKFRSTYQKNVL
jgi:hypothetical protein